MKKTVFGFFKSQITLIKLDASSAMQMLFENASLASKRTEHRH